MKKIVPVVTLAAAALIYAATTFPSSRAVHEASVDAVVGIGGGPGFVRTANDPRSYVNGGFAPDREFALERARQHARGDFEAPGTLIASGSTPSSPETGASPH